MKDKRLEYIVAVLVLFLGFEITLFFTSLLDDNRDLFRFTNYFLTFEIGLNTLAIISLYIYIITPEKEHLIFYRFLHKFSSNLIFLSFTGIFGLLYYFSRDIRINFTFNLTDIKFIETIFILCFIILALFIMFSYHFIEFYKNFNKKKNLAIAVVMELVIWCGFYFSAFLWINFFGSNNFILFTTLIILFIIDLIYFSVSNIKEKEETKDIQEIFIYITMVVINLIVMIMTFIIS